MVSTAIGYLRVSTEEQGQSGLGLEAQQAAMVKFCASNSWEVGNVSLDVVSGASGLDKRPALLEAIGQLGKGDVLVVAKRNRLGRDPIVVAMIEAAVNRKGANVMSVAGEGTEGEDPTHVLMRRIVDAFAEYERLVIGARTKAALQAKKDRGERVGHIPYGYRLAPDGIRLVAVESEQATIEEAKALRTGGLSYRAISEELAEGGQLSRAGMHFHAVQIMRMVKM